MRRVVVTGGSGLIGRELVSSLAADGVEAIVLSRYPERVLGLPQSARVVKWDARTAAGWAEFADGADAIVNLAGQNLTAGRWTAGQKQLIRQSRVDAGRAVVAAVQAAKVKPGVVLQASGIGYYGPHGDEIISEEPGAGSDFQASITIDWEASTAPVEALGVRRVITRSGVALTMKGPALPRMMLPFRFFVGGPIGSGRQWFPWIHIADKVAAMRFLLAQPQARGAFNLTAPTALTNAEFSKALGNVMGRPSWLPVPAFAMRLVFGEMADVLLKGQRAIPQRLQEVGFVFRYPDAESALRNLIT